MHDHFHPQCLQYQALNLEHHTKLSKSSSPELQTQPEDTLQIYPLTIFALFSVELLGGGWWRIKITGLMHVVHLLWASSSCWALLTGRQLESLQQGKGPCLRSLLSSRRALVLKGNTETRTVGSSLESQLLRRLSQEGCKFKSSLGYWLSSRPT